MLTLEHIGASECGVLGPDTRLSSSSCAFACAQLYVSRKLGTSKEDEALR